VLDLIFILVLVALFILFTIALSDLVTNIIYNFLEKDNDDAV